MAAVAQAAPLAVVALWLAATALWLLSVKMKNASIVDIAWAPAFSLGAWAVVWQQPAIAPGAWLVLGVLGLWGVRLGLHLAVRLLGHAEDSRYQAIRARWEPGFWYKSLGIVFLFQATLVALVSLPAWAIVVAPGSAMLDVWQLAGASIAVVGIATEAVADWQLTQFRRNPANRGTVLNTGLWRYSRHPNYFGNFVLWWGLGLWAASVGGWWTLVGPAIMSVLLLRVSGVALLESTIVDRRPAYAAYIASTSAFVPRPPKKA